MLFCNNLVEINASLSSVKCQKCLRRQLNESVVKSTRCEITIHKSGQPAETQIFVTSALLTQFTGDIPNDDKELFILMCQKLQVVLASDTSLVVTSIKKAKRKTQTFICLLCIYTDINKGLESCFSLLV